jgi:outer membrane protein
MAADQKTNHSKGAGGDDERDHSYVTPARSRSSKLDPAIFSLTDAIALARRQNPRLRSARATIERAGGQKQAAFAAFLPEISLGTQTGATSRNQVPGGPGSPAFIAPGATPGNHSYYQETMQLIWTLYDFGRRAGRYRAAAAQEQITRLQLDRADQTVQFDTSAAYLNILLARASLLTQEEAIRQAESTLKDSETFLKGGVATPDYVLRAEVHLSENRDAYIRAREAELVATAQLNNVMGRNAALPLKVHGLGLPPPETRPSLTESLEIAASQRPEIGFARQAIVAAQENVVTAKAAFYPRIHILGSCGNLAGTNVATGWQRGVGIYLDFPLYTGGLHRGDLRAAEAEVASAVADAQTILDNVSLEVSQAVYSEESAQQRLTLAQPAVIQAQETLREVRVRYRNGNAIPTEIVDAENALTRAQERYNSALYTYLFALARLDYATGRQQGAILCQSRGAPEPSPPKLPGLEEKVKVPIVTR